MNEKYTVVFGAGKVGKMAIKIIAGKMLLCDNDSSKVGSIIEGIPVIDFKDLCEKYIDGAIDRIIISCGSWCDVLTKLLQNKFRKNDIYVYFPEKEQIVSCCSEYPFSEEYGNIVFSQDGEEVFLKEYFRNKTGFYVDVGAHHPFRFSNTYWAYRLGWRGLNIEPNLDKWKEFMIYRKNDINLNLGIASTEGVLQYYMFDESALNTFSKHDAEKTGNIKEIREVVVRRLDSIFVEYHVSKIDYLDIDVEGLEMEVLKSNDWSKYKPQVVLIEQKMSIEDVLKTNVYEFMSNMGYSAKSKYNRTVIYTL